ncbi:Glutathione S-transferase [Coemansia sp. RSA 521]|nr:Glutathione S-transferase [Coemansia sp. RSA 562]KAJ2200009.1 Glutathione S-transferase [Coemansia sp. RSA 521]KAJ2279973.1 Glutathione S-transferase [Coemansia sp. RSA 451]
MAANKNLQYTLRYFDRIGVAEGSKLLLSAANVEWTEEHPEWPLEKPNQPFGRMPVLIEKHSNDKDFVICESGNIERYLARAYGFIPSDIRQAALQEQLRDQASDMFAAFISQLVAKSEEDRKENFAKFDGLLDKLVEVQTKQINANGNIGHMFGDRLSYADIVTYAFYKIIVVGMVKRQANIVNIVKPKLTPQLIKLITTVEANPLLASYTARGDSLAAIVTKPTSARL